MTQVKQVGAGASLVRRRSRWWWLLGSLLILGLAGGGWYGWKRWGAGAKSENAYILATIQRGDIEDQVSATGSLQPRNYVDVGAQVSGQLRKLLVEVGSEVREGDVLAEIDAETSIAKVDASRAQLRAQEAQLAERELTLVKAERDLQRQKNLMAEDATTAETLQNAETTVRTARVQIQSLKAQMDQLRASMRIEEANLKFTRIFAPMDGTVVSITARQGQALNVNQSAPTLLRVADLSMMTVQTQVSEADVSKLRVGMPVYFTTLGGQGRRWYGQLKRIEPTPTVTNNVVLYNALFEVPNNNRNLMTQMTAQVFFVVAEARDVLMVPMSALTVQRGARGPRGGNSNERPAEGGAPGAPAAPSAPAASGVRPALAPASIRLQSGFIKVADAPANDNRPAGANGANGPGGMPRMDREAFQNMSEEERARFREMRRRQREEAGGGQAAPAGPGAAAGPRGREQAAGGKDGERSAAPGANRPNGANGANAANGAAGPKGPNGGNGGIGPNGRRDASGQSDSAQSGGKQGEPGRPARGPRQAKVKVMLEDGTIEERDITIGISNRVHAEVLSGLKEGDRVIAGTREAEQPRRANAQQGTGVGQSQNQNFGAPGGPTGAAQGGAGGGARR